MHNRWITIDLETYPDRDAILDSPEPDKRLKDPEKIAADIADKRAQQIDRCSIDPYAGRIVAVGWQTEHDSEPHVQICDNEEEEASALVDVAVDIENSDRHIVGYRIIGFDWPWLVTRARLLGVRFPQRDTRKYGNRDITDLHSLLTFDGNIPEAAMRRSLKNFARRFGIPVDDAASGADVRELVQSGDWDTVIAHCASDVRLTVALADRLGIFTPKLVEARV